MLTVIYTKGFKSDLKKVNPKYNKLIMEVIRLIAYKEPLPKKYRNHQLTGNYVGCMECHIKPDLLLIYRIDNNVLVLELLRIGSHSTLFK